ncbi:genetic competence negative regulator [Scopulibacillus cellulosilyticus]|uniref:Adapter protein MecA n=1 Tax=Scopulibacillus cellulosilyticus TaxID=2665665 RepID=A0ABW2PVX3_9BACL
MRLERLNSDKIKIFLTFDDLKERGISKEDMWHDLPKVHQLFRDMIMEADDELGFQAEGPIEVEVFSLPAQGMVVIVSKSFNNDDLFDDDDDYIEMQVTLDECDDILYKIDDFEDVIALAHKLHDLGISVGKLYYFDNKYYLHFDEETDELINDFDLLVAVLAEYGNPSTMTSHRLIEYGKVIMNHHAVQQLYHYFVEKETSH